MTDYSIPLLECWDLRVTKGVFEVKTLFNPVLSTNGPRTVGLGEDEYALVGRITGVTHRLPDTGKPYTELEGEVIG